MRAKRRRRAHFDDCPVPLDGPVPVAAFDAGAAEFLAYAREYLGPEWDYFRMITRDEALDRLDTTETVAEFLAAEEKHLREERAA